MKKHSATKKTKPRLFDDIVADQDLWLPGLEYFFVQERGMHELADYAKPHFEKLLLNQRNQAVDAINQIKSDIQDQYNKELKESRNKIAVETTGAFLKALKFQHNDDPNKVRGLKMAYLYVTGTLVCRFMSCPTNICCTEGIPIATSQITTKRKKRHNVYLALHLLALLSIEMLY